MSELQEKIAKSISLKVQKILPPKSFHLAIEMNKVNPLEDGSCVVAHLLKNKDSNALMTEIFAEFDLDFFDDGSAATYEKSWAIAKNNDFYVDSVVIKTPSMEEFKKEAEEQILNKKKALTLDLGPIESVQVQMHKDDKGSLVVEAIPTEKEVLDNELKKFNLADVEIAKLKTEYAVLKIEGISDTEGYEKVDTARKFMLKKRTAVESVRKSTKDFYLKTGKAIDNEAKRLTVLLLEVENSLADKCKKVDDELEKIRKDAEFKKTQALNYRIIELAKYNYATDVNALGEMTEEAFEVELTYAKDEFAKEAQHKQKLKEDQDKLDEEKKAFDAEKKLFEESKGLSTGGGFSSPKKEEPQTFEKPDEINTHAVSTDEHLETKEPESLFSLKDPFDNMDDSDEYKLLEKPKNILDLESQISGVWFNVWSLGNDYLNFFDNDETYTHNNDYESLICNEVMRTLFGQNAIEFIKKRRP